MGMDLTKKERERERDRETVVEREHARERERERVRESKRVIIKLHIWRIYTRRTFAWSLSPALSAQ